MKESGTEKYRGYLSILLVNLTQYRDLNYLLGYPDPLSYIAARWLVLNKINLQLKLKRLQEIPNLILVGFQYRSL